MEQEQAGNNGTPGGAAPSDAKPKKPISPTRRRANSLVKSAKKLASAAVAASASPAAAHARARSAYVASVVATPDRSRSSTCADVGRRGALAPSSRCLPRGRVGAEKPSSTRGVHYLTRRRRALRGIVVARGAAAPFAHDTGDAREEICARLRVGTERAGRAVLRRPVFLEGRPPVRVCGRPLMRCHFWPMPFMLKTYDL